MTVVDSPLIVPLAALAVVAVAIVSTTLSHAYTRRLSSEARLAMLNRGLSVAEMERLFALHDEPRQTRTHARSMAVTRRAAAVLISFGIGLGLFFVMLALLLHQSEVLSGAAVSLIPLCLGLGFAVEHRLQAREAATSLSADSSLA